mmetsp:Transcript_14774/g.39784  ORF Transcript_14774/g.39784 Transcript_14774/m.39784 type:complete len:235 (-) Transcript_14774:646-1350(-)
MDPSAAAGPTGHSHAHLASGNEQCARKSCASCEGSCESVRLAAFAQLEQVRGAVHGSVGLCLDGGWEVKAGLLGDVREAIYGEVVHVKLGPGLAKGYLMVRDLKLAQRRQRELPNVGDDCVHITLVRAHAAGGGNDDVVSLVVELPHLLDVLRDGEASRVVAWRLWAGDECVVQVEAEAHLGHLRPARAELLHLWGRAQHVEVRGLEAQRLEGLLAVEHSLDDARGVVLAYLVL